MMNVRLPSFADPANLVRQEEQQEPTLPEGVGALRLLQMVYRGEVKVSAQQMRVAIESLPYEQPKLTAIALSSMTAQDFASRLERAQQRSDAVRFPKLIEARADPTD
jgi:hypothetical protein